MLRRTLASTGSRRAGALADRSKRPRSPPGGCSPWTPKVRPEKLDNYAKSTHLELLHGAEYVFHERAGAWAQLNQLPLILVTGEAEFGENPDADEFTEHLTQLRGRDEVAFGAEYLALKPKIAATMA